ncbi:MAG: YHS domain-containing protein [Nitrospirae bacterium]|nr:YHS domain-containing protein [Nitrospirota bacterium]
MKILEDDRDKNKRADPVCGMLVDKDSPFSSEYQKKDYRFCSEKCKSLFEQEPELFISMQDAREKFIESKRTEALKKMADQLTHEIRNPLTSIGGFARRMLKGLPEDASDRKYMERVIEDVERLEQMVNRLVRFEPDQLTRESSNINKVISEVMEVFDEIFRNNKITVRLHLQEKLPPVLLDRGKIKSALSNIFKNSVDAMDKEHRVLEIKTSVAGKQIVVTISDTGKGIPEEKIKYIFDPLFTSKVYGPGLGLAFVKEVIQAHGGTIEVKSTVGKGTTFKIKLPLRRRHES